MGAGSQKLHLQRDLRGNHDGFEMARPWHQTVRMPPSRLVRPRVIYADLERAPDDVRRYELYDGEVCVVPTPNPLHQMVVLRTAELLTTYRQRYGGLVLCAPIDIVLSDCDMLQPDVVFFKRGREQLIDLRRPIRVPADLVIEVTAPATAATDRGKKMQLCARYGVREYWIVDPDARRIEVFWLAIDTYALAETATGSLSVRSTILPALAFSAEALFG